MEKKFEKHSDQRNQFNNEILNLKFQIAGDRARLKKEGKDHFKDDLKTLRKYMQLKTKTRKLMPMIYRSEDKALIQKMCSSLRLYLPTSFFNLIQRMVKQKSMGREALGFANTIEGDRLAEPQPTHDYIRCLYEAP